MMRVISQKAELTLLSIANCSIRRGLPHLNVLTNLEHLNLTKVIEVDNTFLHQVAENCKNMKHLNLSKCITVDDTGIRSLLKLSHLHELILNDVFKITDAPFSGMHNLKKLECESCDSVHDDGIISLMKYAAELEYLNVVSTGVSGKVLSEAAKISKKRTNNLELHVVVNHFLKDDWDEDEDYSPLLIIEGKDERFDDDNASEFDVDDYFDEDDDSDYDYDDDEFHMFNPYDNFEYNEDDEYALDVIRLF